ncbi:DUF2971 domain-containing protein [Acinetobacter sp.]|uniref:DUF2971 domain-containing protein n=1 Tax=Acinetobacter sp. TaxID=472 RepID=UPI00388E0F22
MNYFNDLQEHFITQYADVKQDDQYYYLYKHFSFGIEDTENEYSVLNTFYNCTLRFAKPTAFNDPFDCLSIINYDFSKITKAELNNYIGKNYTHKEFKLYKDKHIRELKALPPVKDWGDQKRNRMHLTCFNNNPLNILMWSHYAQNHKGFMVEFKFEKRGEKIFQGLPIPVKYNNEFPILNYPHNLDTYSCISNPNLGAQMVFKLFANKAEVWSYEKEFRLLLTNKISNNIATSTVDDPIDSSMFSTVIFGAKTKPEAIKKIKLAVEEFNHSKQTNIQTYQSKLKENSYELYVENHPRLY